MAHGGIFMVFVSSPDDLVCAPSETVTCFDDGSQTCHQERREGGGGGTERGASEMRPDARKSVSREEERRGMRRLMKK